MNETVVIGILGIIAAVLILGPLLRARSRTSVRSAATPVGAPGTSDELEELELDHAMGRVSEADYVRWKTALGTDDPVSDAAPPATDARAKAESLVRQWSEKPRRRCEKCGERPEPDAQFCSNCGAGLH
jgi:hypothetical protein